MRRFHTLERSAILAWNGRRGRADSDFSRMVETEAQESVSNQKKGCGLAIESGFFKRSNAGPPSDYTDSFETITGG